MENKKLLGKRIKELRKLSDLTQEKFSEMIGIETTSLSGIESGRHFPSMPTLEKIANNLNVELKTLFEFKHLQPINEIKQDIIKNIDKLDDNQIKLIYKFFDGIIK